MDIQHIGLSLVESSPLDMYSGFMCAYIFNDLPLDVRDVPVGIHQITIESP